MIPRNEMMILKFDGVDGCGKTTLCRAVAETLSSKGYHVVLVNEFASPVIYTDRFAEPVPLKTMQIREAVLDPAFDCDDVERQLLLHFLSRRKNRVEIPYLDKLYDFVIVDRSTLSNYAYGAALGPNFVALSDLAVGDMETADQIFWIDTPIALCAERISARSSDAVERKGSTYFDRVRAQFSKYVVDHEEIRTLDGRFEISELAELVVGIVEGRRKND
jgi:thymidylate kinase